MPAQSATAELAGLRAELEKPAAASRPAAAPAADAPPAGQTEAQLHIEQVLQDLQSALSEAAQNAEDIITEHPLPSGSAAFLLGVAVGGWQHGARP
jgi:hypothetical protein